MFVNDDVFKAEKNNLTLLRVILASAVIWTHSSWLVRGGADVDELSPILGTSISSFAVDGFFFLSGMLVYASLQRSRNVKNFLAARLFRLWPALFVSVVLTAIVGYAASSSSPMEYLTGETLRFIFRNILLVSGAYTLTGVNCGNQLCNVNGSLWTIAWEVRCYITLAVAYFLFRGRFRLIESVLLPATIVSAVLFHIGPVHDSLERVSGGLFYYIVQFDRLWTMFALGIAAFAWRDKIKLSWLAWVIMLALVIAVEQLSAGEWHARSAFVGYTMLCFGFLSARSRAISGRWPDYSYGIYVYAFPVMMALNAVFPIDNFALLAFLTVLFTAPLAILSWHFVELPALNWWRRRRVTRRRPQINEAAFVPQEARPYP